MKIAAYFLPIALMITGTTASGADCADLDTSLEVGQSFICQSQAGEVCVKTGYDKEKEMDGLRIFTAAEDSEQSFDWTIYNDPIWHRCHLAIDACIHQTLESSFKRITAYRYKAPDMWSKRSSKLDFEMDLIKGQALLKVRSYGVNRELRATSIVNLHSCRL